jgi:Asp-tRNA(Asn)/Glu-tRNA(Gln) amidotransferase A subunit family amidase
MAHATDAGGSIRIPASCCGVLGLKPTRGRTPFGPLLGEGRGSLACQHAVTRSVRDCAALLDASCGPDIGDPYCAPPPKKSYLEEIKTPPPTLRIALQTRPPAGLPVDPVCTRAANETAALCEALGHAVEEASPVFDVEAFNQAGLILRLANARVDMIDAAGQMGLSPDRADVESITRNAVEHANNFSAEDYARALRTTHREARAIARFFEEYDVLLSPTLTLPPVDLGYFAWSGDDLMAFADRCMAYTAFTALYNGTGQPAISVPLFRTEDNLPVGSQFVGRFGDESTLLRLAAQLEKARPWDHMIPSGC